MGPAERSVYAVLAAIVLGLHDGEIGREYALCERLKTCGDAAVAAVLPQLIHLLVAGGAHGLLSAPAVERAVAELCTRDRHAACAALWAVEHYLADFRPGRSQPSPAAPALHVRAARLLGALQRAVFGAHVAGDAGTARPAFPRPSAAIVAAGASLGGAVDQGHDARSRELVLTAALGADSCTAHAQSASFGRVFRTESTEDVQGALIGPLALQQYFAAAAKRMNVLPPAFMALAAAVPLYHSAEMLFASSLIDVSQRLATIPRAARMRALRSELAILNHSLPAAVCLPLICSGGVSFTERTRDNDAFEDGSADSPSDAPLSSVDTHPHHKVLRLCADDAVVLNSAERAPFLVLVEILEGGGDLPASITPDASSPGPSLVASAHTPSAVEDGDESVANSSSPDFAPADGDDYVTRMRTAASVLAQIARQAALPGTSQPRLAELQAIKDRVLTDMQELERVRLLDALDTNGVHGAMAAESAVQIAVAAHSKHGEMPADAEDPSAAAFREDHDARVARIRSSSPYAALPGWRLVSAIVKAGADMRQEQLACQLIAEMGAIWREAGLPLWVCPVRVLAAAEGGGLVETVPGAVSLHSIKKAALLRILRAPMGTAAPSFGLREHFITVFGAPDSEPYAQAVDAFVCSLAGYSLATYVLAVKDRHDGNILIDCAGRVVHIDFGFMLSNAPGYVVGVETAPFKLAADWIELLGGLQGAPFLRFKTLFVDGLRALRDRSDRIVLLVDALQRHARLPCFAAGLPAVTSQLKARLHVGTTDAQLRASAERLVLSSAYSLFTRLYDTFQYYSNGIL